MPFTIGNRSELLINGDAAFGAMFADLEFTREVALMLIDDPGRCKPATANDLHSRPIWFKVGVRIARLMAPIQ